MKLKSTLLALTGFFGAVSFAQETIIYTQNGKYGLKMDFGKELLPPECDTIFEIETPTFDFFVADENGVASLYAYQSDKRDLFDETRDQEFTRITYYYDENLKKFIIIGYDKLGNRKQLQDEGGWMPLKRGKNDVAAGKNTDGKYALCTPEKAITGYDFKRIKADLPGIFLALTDTGYVVYNEKAEVLYPYAVNNIFKSKAYEETYIVEKGKLWGVFSTDGSRFIPLRNFKYPKKNFKIERQSANGSLERGFAVEKYGKYGIINGENKELLEFKYDDAYVFSQYDINLYKWGFIALVKEGSSWKFLNAKYKEYKTVEFDKWLVNQGEHGLVLKGGKVYQLDLKTFEFSQRFEFYNDANVSVITNDDGKTGVFGEGGKIILPFDFEIVTLYETGDNTPFIVATKEGKDGIYSIDGENIVPHKYTRLVHLISGDKEYFEVGKGNMVALAYWNREKNTIAIVTDYIFHTLQAGSKVEGKPIAIGKHDDKKYYVYRDGKTEELK